MKLDIYKRAEAGGKFSYLAVPEGEIIPNEATNIDWEDAERGLEFDENDDADSLSAYAIAEPVKQIDSKGYAITSVNDLASAPSNY